MNEVFKATLGSIAIMTIQMGGVLVFVQWRHRDRLRAKEQLGRDL